MSLFYPFPRIENINDVLPHIDENFRSIEKDGLIFINYNLMGPNVFPQVLPGTSRVAAELARRAAIRRECRGITFDAQTGAIVSRPLHKFFNVNERPDVTLDLLGDISDHAIFEKLDGSMVRPLPIGGGIRWGTKMGVTETALMAEEFVADKAEYRKLAEDCIASGLTPIFEFCSRRSRIVVDYPEDQIVLLAVRNNLSGSYISRSGLEHLSKEYGVPLVAAWGENSDTGALIQRVRNMDTGEGVVLSVGAGHFVKIKADAYVRLHKAKDHLRTEMDLLDLVYCDKLDDVIPVLSNEEQDRIWAYLDAFRRSMNRAANALEAHYAEARDTYAERKDFAMKSELPQPWKGRVLDLWNGKFPSAKMAVESTVSRLMSQGEYGAPGFKARSSLSSFESVKEAYGLHTGWDEIMYGKEAA